MDKRVYRSRVDCKIAGVCGGIGEYFQIDPVIIRIFAVLLIFADGIGLLAYIVAWIIMPQYPIGADVPPPRPVKRKHHWGTLLPGLILLVVGVLFLMDGMFWWFDFWDILWPAILIVVGLLLIFGRPGRDRKDDPVVSGESGITGEVNNVG